MIKLEVSSVPVVQSFADKTVVGFLKLDDILKRITKSLKPTVTVGAVMSTEVVTCSPEDEVSYVWSLMERTRCSGLPVTRYNKQKRRLEVIGVITRSDIVRSGTARLGEESYKGGRLRSVPRVRGLMRTPAITATSNMPLSEAVELMVRRNVGRLPVVDQGNLVGILSRGDAIRACLR
jgi:CBS domain-containing protein